MSRTRYPRGSLGWAVTRAQWRALGLAPSDLDKPKIAVVNTSSSLSICYAHLDGVSERVQAAIRAAGGVAFEVRTSAPSDGLFFGTGGRRHLADAREVVARDVEMMVGGADLDGLVLLSSCDTTTPAHLVAAARLDRPAIVLPCGYQRGGAVGGRAVDVFDVYEGLGALAGGRTGVEALEAVVDAAIACPGVCNGLGTANTMHILAEALGLALPGAAPIAGDAPRLAELAGAAGRRIVALVAEGVRPRRILGRESFANAVKVLAAIGGAASTVDHLDALAAAAGVGFDTRAALAALDGSIPLLCRIAPNGRDAVAALEAAGGALAVLKRLEPRLGLDAPTVAGRRWGEVLAGVEPPPAGVLGSLDAPAAPEPGLLVLRGDLAPGGALVRPGAAPAGMRRFAGPVRRLPDAAAAFAALGRGAIRDGEVLVIDAGVDDFACALHGAGLSERVAVLSPGGFSGLSRGLVVGYARAGTGEPGAAPASLQALHSGDRVAIDLDARAVSTAS